jgi:hypothetical protein
MRILCQFSSPLGAPQADAAEVRANEAKVAAEKAAAGSSNSEETRALTASLHGAQQTSALLKQQLVHCQGLLEETQASLGEYRWMMRGANAQYDVPSSYVSFDLGFESQSPESTAAVRANPPSPPHPRDKSVCASALGLLSG